MYYESATHWFQWIAGIFTLVNVAWLVHLTLDCARVVEARARRTEKIDLFEWVLTRVVLHWRFRTN